ncbi:dTDP-4-amino-4,6-dideoxygalactose transaminase [Hyphomonas sp.]|uniref:dTDP-4-amino-4,6-dideoxygalactose transaminase n=1 Tax=Hyphomonas sp. TaxID=87 RepID=UPI0030FAF24D
MSVPSIPFNRPAIVGKELDYIQDAIDRRQLSGDGYYTEQCQAWINSTVGCQASLLTHSCTAALEMAVILAGVEPGDEVIMPSYTFVSTANAVVLRGGVPVFIDIRDDTLNMDENLVEAAITSRTKAIITVHYAGVGSEMSALRKISDAHGLILIEDAAQALGSTYEGKQLGSLGHLAAVSFHETKNITCGEGGALLINDPAMIERAEIIREKGTNRKRFFRGQVDKYTWVDIGSSFLPGELNAAFLFGQLEKVPEVTARRLADWNHYYETFSAFDTEGLRLPIIPANCEHNGHLFYLLLPTEADRSAFIAHMKANGIMSPFHYVPLHSSPGGQRFARVHGSMALTDSLSERLVRLPLYFTLGQDVERVVDVASDFIENL